MGKEKSAAHKYLVEANTRMLNLYKEVNSAERVKGGYRRGWGWPPASAMEMETRKLIEAQADPEVAALHANLVSHIADTAGGASGSGSGGGGGGAAPSPRRSPRLTKRPRDETEG